LLLGDPELELSLSDLARNLGADGATLAIAFALMNPMVATVLFGATRPEQIRANVAALELAGRLDQDAIAALRAIRAIKQS